MAGPQARARRGMVGRAAALAGLALLGALGAPSRAAEPPPPVTPLPIEVEAALRKAKLPVSALVVEVQDANTGQHVLEWNEQTPVNPASLFKLVTTYAALDLLGPAWQWRTPVYASGTLRDGVLDGSVAIRGQGDPKLVVEQVWLLLRRLQQQGVREIRGDILLDRSAFAPTDRAPGDFDGEPNKPQNVQPDALLMNYKSVVYSFVPDAAAGLARIGVEPALAGVQVDATVPLATGPCDDWRAGLKAQLADPARVRFAGAYPANCGERSWPLAATDAAGYGARLVEQLWRESGGRLGGSVREGPVPAGARLLFEQASPALAEVVRDINKYSNNLMAEQLFLSLALANGNATGHAAGGAGAITPASAVAASAASVIDGPRPATAVRPDDARAVVRRWLVGRFGEADAASAVVDNGSGLSRDARLSAQLLARLLQQAWSGPVMSELMSSLPVSGTDGTLKRSTATAGRAHLKTGSLRDVAGVAGYVLSNTGRRYVLVAIVNHAQAAAARPALDALVQWTIRDAPPR